MLDDQERMAELDPSDMAGAIAGYPKQLQDAATMALPDVGAIKAAKVKKVLFVGMGGSGAGGAYAVTYLDGHGTRIAREVRDYDIPYWVDDGTLVVATSYSGDTEETLSCVAQAIERGAQWLAITSGGLLAEAADHHGVPCVRVPGGYQPRAAFGYLMAPLMRALGQIGLVDRYEIDTALGRSVDVCRTVAERCDQRKPMKYNPAKRMAQALRGRTVVLMAEGPFGAVAERIRCQLNENSKNRAFVRTLPEANHNDTVAWTSGVAGDLWAALWIGRFDRNPALAARSEFTRELMQDHGVEVHEWEQHDDDLLVDMIATTYFGDWVSLYLAFLNGENPSNVSVIPELKRRAADAGELAAAKRRLGIG